MKRCGLLLLESTVASWSRLGKEGVLAVQGPASFSLPLLSSRVSSKPPAPPALSRRKDDVQDQPFLLVEVFDQSPWLTSYQQESCHRAIPGYK